MQSAAVIGSIVSARLDPSAFRVSLAALSGSLPRSASLVSTSAQLATLIAAPLAIASMTISAPSSSWRTAINAEASRTAAASVSGTALGGLALATFGLRFGAPIRDQLVNQAPIRSHVRE
jgi:hypothetical protein